MIEIVCGPGSQELTQRNRSQSWVFAFKLQLVRCQREIVQRLQIFTPLGGEDLEQFRQGTSAAQFVVPLPVERLERPPASLGKNLSRTRNPVGSLPPDQVPHNLMWRPRLGTIVRVRPVFVQAGEQGPHDGRRLTEGGNAGGKLKFHE